MIDVMKTLPQIIATFLAVGATFIAAYLIYLYSAQANIDEKIQIKGIEISNLLKSAPTYRLRFWNPGFYLLKEYRKKYPKKSLVLLYHSIANDLSSAVNFDNTDAVQRLSSFEKGNLKGPVLGRIWLRLMENSMDYLAPPEVWWPSKGHLLGGSSLPKSTEQAELFPFGPLGVEKWSNDFKII